MPYTRIYNKGNEYFQCRFRDKKTEIDHWSSFANIKDALIWANEKDVEYHSKYKNELPKGITFDLTNSRFRLHIWYSPQGQKSIISSKSLQKVFEARKYMIMNIIDIL